MPEHAQPAGPGATFAVAVEELILDEGELDPATVLEGAPAVTEALLWASPDGKILAFMNILRSYAPGETTIDLMRHRRDAPHGIMDSLFAQLFERQRQRGFKRFSLGLAPLSGFREGEEAGAEERAVQYFLQRSNFLFSYSGLSDYKAKFATHWEPRYTIYRNVLDLPRLAVALLRVSGLKNGVVRRA